MSLTLLGAGRGSPGPGAPARLGYVSQTVPGSTWGEGLNLAIDGDGKLLVAGTHHIGNPLTLPFVGAEFKFVWTCARYNTDGTLDTDFGDYGTAYLNLGDVDGDGNVIAAVDNECTDVIVLASGKILLSGIRTRRDGSQPASNLTIARLNSDGTLDTSFGPVGTGIADHSSGGSEYFSAVSIGLQTDGKIVAAISWLSNGGTINRAEIRRFSADGILETTFGVGGVRTVQWAGGGDTVYFDMKVLASDKILIIGQSDSGVGSQTGWFLARLNSDGTADTTFGGAGLSSNATLTTFANDPSNAAAEVAVLPSGKLVIVGWTSNASSKRQLTLGQYTADGDLDTANFGTDGLTILDPSGETGFGPDTIIGTIAVLPDGKYFIAGDSDTLPHGGFGDAGKFLTGRVNADGTMDTTYGTLGNGLKMHSLGSTSEVIYGMISDGAGNQYAAGHKMDDGTSPREAVAVIWKFDADGNEDTTWGDLASPPAAPTAPTVVTSAAGNVAATTATLNGTVDPNGTATTYHFDYGPSPDFGFRTAETSAGSGTDAVAVEADVTGLPVSEKVYFRLVASNGALAFGLTDDFTTLGDIVEVWNFESVTGTNPVGSVRGITLTNFNGVTHAAGLLGNAASYDGTSKRLTSADNVHLSMRSDLSYTLAAWVKFAALGANRGIITKTDATTLDEYTLFYRQSDARIVFQPKAGSVVVADELGVPALDTWYRVVAILDLVANEARLVVNDGTPDVLGSVASGAGNGLGTFSVGSYGGTASWAMNGLIEQVVVAKEVWDAAELTADYNAGAGRTLP